MDHGNRGEAALAAGNPEEAIKHYTEAIKATPSAFTYYLKRSISYQRTSKYPEAYADANVAITLATKRAKRELIGQAQLRRAIALFYLERYGDAEFALGLAKKYDEKEKTLGIWEAKLKTKMQGLNEEDERRKITIKEQPDVVVPDVSAAVKAAPAKTETTAAKENDGNITSPQTSSILAVQTPASKIRHDWYQNNDSVIISLMAKGVPKDLTSVDIQENSLSISFPLASGSSYDFSLEPLFSTINVSVSSFKILSTKIEITLKKSTPGQKWPSLEGTTTSEQNVSATPTGPVYPTSSKTGAKNWDKIANSFVKPKTKPKTKAEPGSDEENNVGSKNTQVQEESDRVQIGDDLEEDGGDPAHAFFKQLYAGASDETKRAMMKSYQESGGTALSTNWKEVSQKRVEVTPPDGMVEKKW